MKKFNQYLLERQKTFSLYKDLLAWQKQQYVEMQAEHAWLDAKLAFESALRDACGAWEPVPSKERIGKKNKDRKNRKQ